mgnify:FL=1
MKNYYFIFSLAFFLSCENSFKYPKTEKIDVVDEYFNTKIIDPYRWLEDDMSPETESWVASQNEFTFKYLDKIPFRNKLKNRLEELKNWLKQLLWRV